MKRLFRLVCTVTVLGLIFVNSAEAGSKAESRKSKVAELTWSDLSTKIPATVLDEHVDMPLFSLVASRGQEWIAGNPNQLVFVTAKGVTDLTLQLKEFGFRSVRQIASDGQQWLVVGDSGYWQAQPDLAFRFDGKYWKNVSFVMGQMPPQEWIGQIVGRRGLWLLPTARGLYAWDNGMTQIAAIPLSDEIRDSRSRTFHAVRDAWIADIINKDGARKFFRFDGETFTDITPKFNGADTRIALASNGADVFAAWPKGIYTDGVKIRSVGRALAALDGTKRKPTPHAFWSDGLAVWNGKRWILWDAQKNLSTFDSRAAVRLPDTRDTFLDAGYGTNGSVLFVGYATVNGKMKPKIVIASEK